MGVFLIRNKKLDTIQLNQNYPQDSVFYNNFLIISHYDLVRREGGSISLYNFKSKEVYNYPIECGIEQMTMREENIYILSENKIYKYKIVEAGINLEKTIDIDMLTDDSYCSGIFAYAL